MKNVFLYLNPNGISKNADTLVKMQIENILELGWKKEDVVFIANFPYEYMGVRSMIVSDDCFFSEDPASTKCYAMAKIFDQFSEDCLYWIHDIDHFQQEWITDEEITELMGECDFALCDYGRRIKYNCGSIFFRKSAGDIFKKISDVMVKYRKKWKSCEEERSLMILTTNNENWGYRSSVGAENSFSSAGRTDTDEVNKRIKRMPITYNFADYNLGSCWKMCDGKPKTAHFNPFPEKITRSNPTGCKLNFFMGDNRLGVPLMNDRLISIFKRHGLTRTN